MAASDGRQRLQLQAASRGPLFSCAQKGEPHVTRAPMLLVPKRLLTGFVALLAALLLALLRLILIFVDVAKILLILLASLLAFLALLTLLPLLAALLALLTLLTLLATGRLHFVAFFVLDHIRSPARSAPQNNVPSATRFIAPLQ
jgi:hypothetical protein